MNMRIAARTFLASALFALMTVTVARAADAKDATPPVSAEPQNTTATYGDWVLQCTQAQNGARVCQLTQPFQLQGQQGLYAQLLVTRGEGKNAFRVVFEMAPNISFPSTVKIGADDKDPAPIELSWRRCMAGPGCFADADLKDDTVKKWRAQTGPGRITFKDSAGRDTPINFSFRGFPQGLDGLAKD